MYTAGPYFFLVEFIWSIFHEQHFWRGVQHRESCKCVCFLLFVQNFCYGLSLCVPFALFRIFTKILLLCFLILYFFPFKYDYTIVRSVFLPHNFFLLLSLLLFAFCVHRTFASVFFFSSYSFFDMFLSCLVFQLNSYTWYKIVWACISLSHSVSLPVSLYHNVNAFVHSKQYYRRTTHGNIHTHTNTCIMIQQRWQRNKARIDEYERNKATAYSAKHREKATRHTRLSFKQKENEQKSKSYCCCCCCYCRLYSWLFFRFTFFPCAFPSSRCSFGAYFFFFFVNSFYSVPTILWTLFFAVSQTCLFMNITFFHDLFRLAHFIRLFIKV